MTLTGPGGVGKTRLAVQAASVVGASFPDGVWVVPLAPIRDPNLVGATVVRAVGVVERADRAPVETLTAAIRERRVLLVLDNLEHLLAAAPLVAHLLVACPNLTILVTSRARLNLSGEHELTISPLALPAAEANTAGMPLSERALATVGGAASVQLFVARAQAVDAGFRLTAANAGAVAAICVGVDGLPLAIELAAAQTRLFPPPALLARMERRLPLLTGGPRDQPARLRTMADAIAWSYDLLEAEEQALFRRLAVCVGGCTLESAESLSRGGEEARRREDDVLLDVSTPRLLDSVRVLVDHRLLGRVDQVDGEPRLTMLETIREYGRERLGASGEAAEIAGRHASYFLGLAERAEPELTGPGQIAWLDRLETDVSNLRAALAWFHDTGDGERGLRLAAALWTFWVVHDRVPEGRRWLEMFLGAGTDDAAGRTKALVAAGDLAERLGDYESAALFLDEGVALAQTRGDRVGEAAALRGRGNVAISVGESARDRDGDVVRAAAEFDRAEALLSRGLVLAREIGDAWGVAKAKHWLAILPLERGDWGRAAAELEAVLLEFRRLGDLRQVCMVVGNIGGTLVEGGDLERARSALSESVPLARQLGYRWWVSWCLSAFGQVALLMGDAERAARLIGAVGALRPVTGEPLRAGPQGAQDKTVEMIQARIGAEATAAAMAAGAALQLDDAIAEALAVGTSPLESNADVASGPRQAAGALTARELDVLRLLVEGQSNAEIAGALFVGVRTVRAHVGNILAKLGVPTRTAAATYAVRQGLV
ncbi:MAG: hypothetical protein H0T91_13420 [Propionibacteriaceae bacterium]|nr:hypothetical protein [Propionibacteriaceae bacterium]